MTRVFEVTADCAVPIRLDKYIAAKSSCDGAPPSRSALKSHGAMPYINGKRAKLSQMVHEKDNVRVEWQEENSAGIEAQNIPLNIIYEDKNVTVINKAQGMVTHPAAGHWSGTLVNALLGRYTSALAHCNAAESNPQSEKLPAALPSPSQICNFRPGIVHRLDKDTSGVIITARNDDALLQLQAQFKARAVRKEYIAITKGRPKAVCGVIDCRIARDKKNRKRFSVTDDSTRGRSAITIYHCIACYGPYSVMRLRLKTGRTHQIRVHLKHIGCPILGDSIYNTRSQKPCRDELFPDALLMLHSRLIEICLPGEKKRTLFIAPVPKRFIEVMKVLKAKYPKEVISEKGEK